MMAAFLQRLLTAAIFGCFALAAGAVSGEPGLVTQTEQVGPMELTPGGVRLAWFRIQVPDFHFSLRSITGDIVDEDGEPAPLDEVYLHHWVIQRDFEAVGADPSDEPKVSSAAPENAAGAGPHYLQFPLTSAALSTRPSGTVYPNSGLCAFPQWFAVGAESRHTRIEFPAPFGVDAQNPANLPAGHTEAWYAEVHLIDLRGTKEPRACLECRCSAYNVSVGSGKYAGFMPEGYRGGLFCCSDNAGRCQVAEGFAGPPKKYFLRYTIEYVRHTPCAVPVRVYFMDASDPTGGCGVEYSVDDCDPHGSLASCVDTRERRLRFPTAGRIVFAVGHQHVGALGLSLHRGADGSTICESLPIYGQGSAAGDEAGFVVGMRSCPLGAGEAVRVAANETLVLRSTYSRLGGHTGVMGIMYLALAADEDFVAPAARSRCPRSAAWQPSSHRMEARWIHSRPVMASFAAGVVLAAAMSALGFSLMKKNHNRPSDEYTALGAA